MQQQYKKTYETYKHTGRTVKLDKDVWEHIKIYLYQNYSSQEIAIYSAEDKNDKLENMDEAFGIISRIKDDIKKIEIKAETEKLQTHIRFINKKEAFDDALYINISSDNKSGQKSGKEFEKNLMRKAQLFAKTEFSAFWALILSAFCLLNVVSENLEFSMIGELSTVFIAFMVFSFVNQAMTNLMKYKKGVQFWIDKYDVSEYTKLNKKRKVFMWLTVLLAAVIGAAAVLLFIRN